MKIIGSVFVIAAIVLPAAARRRSSASELRPSNTLPRPWQSKDVQDQCGKRPTSESCVPWRHNRPQSGHQPLFCGNITYATEITAFYKGVTQSPWMDLMAQYGIGAGTSLNPMTLPATMDYSKGYVSDEDIQAFLKNLVKTGAILPTVNTYFPIHFQSGIRIQAGFDGNNNPEFSCQNFSPLTLQIRQIILG
ncbi:hypothetical protein BCR33DRAFT_742717 [Rhizoclosmatium globosum]|uniref:Uncharacterized protein n=1 Tax=Rhizoclosmatium globosum TaxID=329046 RepID=A0A1Y2BPD4_9FUNG|nr:hypothetical protein BCR33DRAFT_742717 [Rhizoclosmatium globosum]|eukprot:ORY36447.1 hypothetical protein BCR33DRAFT_742717 [Rhizoclosmatium globosum]